MEIEILPIVGEMSFCLNGMREADLRSLHAMIKSACLPERREWNSVKQQIEEIISVENHTRN